MFSKNAGKNPSRAIVDARASHDDDDDDDDGVVPSEVYPNREIRPDETLHGARGSATTRARRGRDSRDAREGFVRFDSIRFDSMRACVDGETWVRTRED